MRWAKRRHPKKNSSWIVSKYFKSIGERNWVFKEGDKTLFKYSDTDIIRHTKVKGHVSPYNGENIYWATRMGKNPELPVRVTTLLKKQKGKCNHCGLFFQDGDLLEIDHITPKSQGGKDIYTNFQLLHEIWSKTTV